MNLGETERAAELIGELTAYRMALRACITGHPLAHLLHGRIQIEREKGVSFWLAEPAPDSAQRGFEQAMDEIAAMLPARPRTA